MLDSIKYRVNKLLNFLLLPKYYSTAPKSRSDSDNGYYVSSVLRALNYESAFKVFKRDPAYTTILEHVSEELGRAYWNRINEREQLSREELLQFCQNDVVGSPLLINLHDNLKLSGTTLRYCSVLSDLYELFSLKDVNVSSVIELGVGYGGQALVYAIKKPATVYTLVDLNEVLALTKKYLLCHSDYLEAQFQFSTIIELSNAATYDLFISNFAFSELPRLLQEQVHRRIISKASRGYMIMSTSAEGRFTQDELLKRIPGSRILEEVPCSARGNYILVWGTNLR